MELLAIRTHRAAKGRVVRSDEDSVRPDLVSFKSNFTRVGWGRVGLGWGSGSTLVVSEEFPQRAQEEGISRSIHVS